MSYTNGLDNPELYFQTVLWTGNGSNRSITLDGSENMQPDWVWGKNRGNDDNDYLMDSVRGATKRLTTNNNAAEGTSTALLTSFDSDGLSLGTSAGLNASGVTAVGWCWKAGGSASSNSDGSITSSVSANQTAGFSILKFTASGSGDETVGHGLGVKPKMVITKGLDASSPWNTYNENLHSSAPEDYYLALNSTNASSSDSPGVFGAGMTSSVIGVGVGVGFTSGQDYISYCFSEVKSFSKFGSYVGNQSSNGSYIHLGFKPSFVMVKRTDSSDAANWMMYDNKRLGYNGGSRYLIANTIDPEGGSSDNLMDFTSNGFKLRSANQNINRSASYIYMAFSESSFVSSSGIPTNAK